MDTQIPLGIQLRDSASFTNFIPGCNHEVLDYLWKQEGSERAPSVYLWGGRGAGKSHLLQAACHEMTRCAAASAYIPLQLAAQLSPAVLDGLERLALVCIDDVQAIAGRQDWETALFHLLNRLRDQDRQLLVGGNCAPAALPLQLPDLRSRLSWGLVFQLQPLDDEDKVLALQRRARDRGLEMSGAVAVYLLRRCPRDMGTLYGMLERLDQATLAAQRRLTIPFVREFLDLADGR